MNYQKQINLYSIAASAFYNEAESNLHQLINDQSITLTSKTSDLDSDQVNEIKKNIAELKDQLASRMKQNTEIRTLNPEALKESNIVSMFDGNLSRTLLGIDDSEGVQTDIFIVRTFYFDILRDLMSSGFMYQNEKYIFFTSSAGQIRTKKALFIKESTWNKYSMSLMCGLDIEEINKRGGMNANKFLSYLALCNGATEKL